MSSAEHLDAAYVHNVVVTVFPQRQRFWCGRYSESHCSWEEKTPQYIAGKRGGGSVSQHAHCLVEQGLTYVQ